jgi:hypothetical protein
MKTQDILALGNRPIADGAAPDRRSVLLGAILAAVFLFALVASATLPRAEAFAPDPDAGRFSTNLDRGGSLYTLEIVF